MNRSLVPFFRPEGIVLVGASSSEGKLGYAVARNLVLSGYTGAIHFVAQRAGSLFDRTVHSSILKVPNPVDLALLVIPAASVAAAIEDCATRGIRAVIIASAGFREAGGDGAALEKTCAELARAHGIRLLGPNCIGVIDTHLPLDTTFLHPPMPPSGGIGLVSHSGAFCAAMVDWSRQQSFGFSQIVSLGNQADVGESEMLEAVAGDANTRAIALYMEGVSDGLRFMEAARRATRRLPVLALKVGRSESGVRAATSHTAAMVGSDAAFDAAFAKCGILRASTAEELFDWARALEQCPPAAGPRIAVLTNAGGPGVMAADALEVHGLRLSRLTKASTAQLAARLPKAASTENPVDMLASAGPEDYGACLETLLRDREVDAALVILPPPPSHTAESVAEALVPIIREASKPVVVNLLGSQLIETASAVLAEARIPTFPFPERAASALAALVRRGQYIRSGPRDSKQRPFPLLSGSGESPLDLLQAYGIQPLSRELAGSPTEAVELGRRLGFPVVLKIASKQITHKSDIGGVVLDVQDAEAVATGYTHLMRVAQERSPDATVDGVVVQPQLSGGQEVIIGSVVDPQFGPLVMFGAGGTEAEMLNDVAFAVAPLETAEADELLAQTWAGRRLDGYRDIPRVDRAAAREALVRLSWMAYEHPELDEVEVNPLYVLGEGALAVDVRHAQS